MIHLITRRRFLGGALATPVLLGHARCAPAAEPPKPPVTPQTLDLHLHLFGTGDGGSGCRMSKPLVEGPLFTVLSKRLRLSRRAKTLDEGYVLALADLVEGSSPERCLILAQDAVYDRHGRPDWDRTPVYVPNEHLFQVVARYPDRMLPCPSINPDRADALEELDRCAQRGARALKIHPPIQGVDIADKKHTRFFRRSAELKMLVLVHTGHEHSAAVVDIELASPKRLRLGLEEGCTMVACHCGTGWLADKPDMLPDFLAMVRRYENLWGDTSVLGSMARVRDFGRLLAERDVLGRLLHGSDFPFPCCPAAHVHRLGFAKAMELQVIANPLRQDFALKDALGIGRAAAARAYELLVG